MFVQGCGHPSDLGPCWGMPPEFPELSLEPLGEVLHLLRMSGTFYCRSHFTAPWGLDLPPIADTLMFHVVTSGQCWLEVEGAESRLLHRGDLVLVPHGRGHRLASEPTVAAAALFDLERQEISERYEILRHGGGGEATTMMCCVVKFGHPAAQRLVELLPPLICVEAWNSSEMDWVQSTLRLIDTEANELRPGGETVITCLADVLVVYAIRSWMSHDTSARQGWLGALRDKQIGGAITAIHRDPARAWSVEGLAREVAMSRSAFAARFTELVGEPAMRYVTRWRMHVATRWLEDEGVSIGKIAERLGYDSEAAFSRAFKRVVGSPPGAVRKRRELGGSPPGR